VLLAIDVGNTETKLGCFALGGGELLHHWRVNTESKRTSDEYGVFFSQLFATADVLTSDVQAVAISSVVPKLDRTLADVCQRYFGCEAIFLQGDRQRLLAIRTERAAEMGADLVACAIGGRCVYGSPLIVISYGTATVFMAIATGGEYLGVAIAPGISTSIDALVGRTAKLPQVPLQAPEHAIGRDTVSALQSGIVYGFVGQTEALVGRLRAEMGVDARVVATGGMAGVVAQHTKIIDDLHPYLGLIGLREFYLDNARRT
jgi:type III pantothenate kinase